MEDITTTVLQIAQGSSSKGLQSIALGVGAGLGTIGPGVGVGYIFGKVIESVTRQPEMREEITSIQWLAFSPPEAIILYAFLFRPRASLLQAHARPRGRSVGGGQVPPPPPPGAD